MSEALRQFHFLQPWWLLGLLALPAVIWFGLRKDRSYRALSRLADLELLPHLTSGSTQHARLPAGLLALGWMLAVLALAGPTWSRVAEPMFADRAAQVIAISLSRHMLARDVPPSRMERARYKVHDLLAANHDGMNALIGYAGQAFVVAPLTNDAHSLDNLLEAMSPDVMPVDGNDAAQAIELGVKLIRNARLSGGSLVLITDDANAAAQAAARAADAAGVHVSVLGIGTSQGAPIPQTEGGFEHDGHGDILVARRNDDALRSLAQAGGGRYVAMTDDGRDIAALHSALPSARGTTAAQGQSSDVWQDSGPWLLLPLLLVAAMAFRRGWLLLLPLIVLPVLPTDARASGWRDWWQRPDQQAASALEQGQAAKAQQLAQDPAWRGAAAYRAKDYAAAVQALEQAKGSAAPYNLGNALAKLGRYPEAIKAYDRALQLDPHNADARANRQIVEEAMRKRPPQSQSQQQAGGQGGQSNANSQNRHSGTQQQNGQANDQSGQHGNEERNKQGQSGHDQSGSTGNPSQPRSDAQANQGTDTPKQAPAPASSSEQTQAAKAEQALQSQMNQALASMPKKTDQTPTHELGVLDRDDPLSKLPDDVRRDLQRVPDDPGALLRRKFELEYRERMGAQPAEGDQP